MARALLAGLGAALLAGPFGAVVVWRRLAYFGDTLSHAALLGVTLGLLLQLDLTLGIILVCQAVALLLVYLQQRLGLPGDTLLGVLAHTALAVGLLAVMMLQGVRLDLMSYLFGDLLAVTTGDLYWIYGGGLAALAALGFLWRPLLAGIVHEELARVEGVRVQLVQLAYALLLAWVIAVLMKIVGVLLITGLLIIPAAAARRHARGPEAMALLAALLGVIAVAGGLYASLRWDAPASPAIVTGAAVLFFLLMLIPPSSHRLPAFDTRHGGS